MGSILILLSLVIGFFSLVGIIRPLPRLWLPTRKRSFILLISSFVLFVGGGGLLPDPSNQEQLVQELREREQPEQEEGQPANTPQLKQEEVQGDDDPPAVPQDTQTKSEQETKQRTQNKPEFSFTVQEFVRRYNQASQNVASGGLRAKRVFIDEKKELPDAMVAYILAQTTNGDDIYFGVITNKNRDAVCAVFYMVYLAGDTNTMSMVGGMLYGFAATIMAIENPHMPPSERGQRLKEIGVFKVMEEKRAILSRKNNVDYTIEIVESLRAIKLFIKPSSP